MNKTLCDIFNKVDNNEELSKEEAVALLNIDNHSMDFYSLIGKANELSRKEYGNRGYVFAQIGLNSAPCSGNCKFCSLARDSFTVECEVEKGIDEIITLAKSIVSQKADALFLMTTADYSLEKYFDIARQVKALLPNSMKLVANIGDFDLITAKQLKAAGFTSVYHIVRLNEGIDTDLPVQIRLDTLNAIKEAELELIYCIEPIGPEHTYSQIADEMLRAREYDVEVMAAMRRVCVPDTPLFQRGEISELELTKIVAATRLVTRPKTSMNVHEPMKMPLLAGVNQLYAEIGINPRDNTVETEDSRGFTIKNVAKMLSEADYICGE